MNVERDKFLTEQMGLCWHEPKKNYAIHNNQIKCVKCKKYVPITSGTDFSPKRINFDTWEGFGLLWEFAQKQEWWREFRIITMVWDEKVPDEYEFFDEWYINPTRFAAALAEFLREK